jgi:multidrug efflux pump subunit AcrA (membrane-fusion protein)
VQLREFRPTIELIGQIEPVRRSLVSSEVEGLVEAVEKEAGDRVEIGDVLVRLKTTQREIRRRRAEAELELAREQLRELETGSREEEIRQAEAAVRDARALLEEAERDLERNEALIGTDAISERELTDSRAKALSWRAIYNQRVAAYDLVKAGPREEEIARAAAEVRIREAALDEIVDEIDKATIRAPFAGALTEKLVEVGRYVNRGEGVFTLLQMNPIRAVVAVPETVIDRVKLGDRVRVRLEALPKEDFEGDVEAIVPSGDPRARTFPVRVLLDNTAGRFLPGMAVRGRVPISGPREALAVPADSIVRGPAGTVVYAVREGAAALVPVTVGLADGGWVEVEGPLTEGEPVIVRGNERLRPGQPVEVIGAGEGGGGR